MSGRVPGASVNDPISGEHSTVEAVLLERVGTLEDRVDAHEQQLEERRKSHEGLRREVNETLLPIRIALEKSELRLQHIERLLAISNQRNWQTLGNAVQLIVGAAIAVGVSYLSKR